MYQNMNYIKDTINFYDQNIDEYVKKTAELQDKNWLNKFTSYLPTNGSVLDIGCAFGRDTIFFASKEYASFGIDLSEKMISKAKKSIPSAKFYVMNMLDLKFETSFFDGIWCSATLLHLNKDDALKSLSEMKRVLKPEGIIYLNLKEGNGEKIIIDNRYKNAKKFYSYYTETEIKNMLANHGFKILDFKLEKTPEQDYRDTGIIYLIAKNDIEQKYQDIWKSAVRYLNKGLNKDFVLHTKGVVKAMKLILKKEKGDPDILIPAAILHDVGWAKVPRKYQDTTDKKKQLQAMKLHIKYAPEIISEILRSLNYKTSQINEIIEIVKSHKFCKPRKLSKKLLIDADQLSDVFEEQFNSDIKAYNSTPEKLYNFRMKDNAFYTKTAENIFLKLMKERKREFKNTR